MSYKSVATPTTLLEALEVIGVMQEYLQRQGTVQGTDEGGENGGDVDKQVLLIKAQGQNKAGGRVPKIGDLTVMLGATVRSNKVYRLTTDFTPTNTTDALVLVSDGRQQLEISRSGGVGRSFGCPVLVKGNCVNAFDVQTATSILDFRVDTVTRHVFVGAQSRLIVGSIVSVPNHGFFYNHQGDFEILDSGGTALFLNKTTADQLIIGAKVTSSVSYAVFENSAAFVGGFAWDRTTVNADGGTTVLDVGGAVTYVGYTGVGPQTITLPQTSTLIAGAGSKPGAIVIIKDETGVVFGTNDITVQGSGGDTIDGSASRILFQGASAFLITDGANWFEFGA